MTSLRWITVVFACVFAAEVTCRIEDWISHGTPVLSPYNSQSDLLVRDRRGVHGRPNASFQKWRMNQLGMRGPAADSVKAPGTLRIVVAGASEAFGVYESPEKEFPRQLEDSLRAALLAGRCDPAIQRIEVLNAAFRGMSLPTVEQDLRLRVQHFAPDVVLYYPTPAQYLEDQIPTAAVPDTTDIDEALAPLRALAPRFAIRFRDEFVGLVPERVREWRKRRLFEAAIHRRPPEWRFAEPPVARLDAFGDGLRNLITTIRNIGAIPVLATHANAFPPGRPWNERYLSMWENFYPRAPASVIVDFDARARVTTIRVAHAEDVTMVDAASRMHAGSDSLFADFSHFTDHGAAVMAGLLKGGVFAALANNQQPTCR